MTRQDSMRQIARKACEIKVLIKEPGIAVFKIERFAVEIQNAADNMVAEIGMLEKEILELRQLLSVPR